MKLFTAIPLFLLINKKGLFKTGLMVYLNPGGGGGVLTYKMGMYVPPYVKKKGAYGVDQTEKVDAFRAERTVKVVSLELIELGKSGCIQKKWVLLELIELKK